MEYLMPFISMALMVLVAFAICALARWMGRDD